MPSDFQNKAESPDGSVVALHRAEFVASIEKKLSEARRFFSLHDYNSCEALVQEVLAADPQNSKAKALLDLSSIKLSKRKLYKKIAEPQPHASLPSGTSLASTASAPSIATGFPDSQRAVETSGSQPEPLLPPKPSSSVIEAPRRRRRGLPEPTSGLPQDSIRERTISALVDLLKNKDATIQDWQADHQARIGSPPTPHPASPSNAPTTPGATEAPPGVFATWQPSQPLLHQPPAQSFRTPGLEANRDFLPGSLDELFALEPVSSAPALRVEPAASPAVTPQNNSTVPAETAKAPQETRSAVQIETPRQPEVGFQPLPPAAEPPAPKKEVLKKPSESSPVKEVAPSTAPPAAPPSAAASQVIHLPDIRIFDQIAAPRPLSYEKEVERKIEQRSEERKNSELQAEAIAQIKKYLYQEEYDLCARELARIRDLFPQNSEIQAFVENTSKRLVELQRIKKFEIQARDLMASAVAFYQEGKREEALIAVREILRVNPNHVQAREFVSFVERHQGKEKKQQQPAIQRVRACRSCGSEVDAVSQFCYHCGKRL